MITVRTFTHIESKGLGARGGNWTRDLRITSAFNRYVYEYPRTEDVDKYRDDDLTNSVELCRMRVNVP